MFFFKFVPIYVYNFALTQLSNNALIVGSARFSAWLFKKHDSVSNRSALKAFFQMKN